LREWWGSIIIAALESESLGRMRMQRNYGGVRMRKFLVLATCFAVFAFCGVAAGQSGKSPEVHGDGTVSFRLMMPNAQKVELRFEGMSGVTAVAMTKDASGAWSATTTPLAADIYAYQFHVDGVDIIDPGVHEFVPNHFEQGGLFTLPGKTAEPWEETEVSHGVVQRYLYASKIRGDESDYYVYTPPGFDARAKTKYPVLYLLHGYSDYTNAWTVMGHAQLILDNLIAQGKSKAMIVVMPSGYGWPKVLEAGWGKQPEEDRVRNRDNFAAMLLEEIIPRIEKQYPVWKDGTHRAIAGLSMGGGESLYVGLNHSGQFAWIGSMSAGMLEKPETNFASMNVEEAKKVKLLWIACGKEDRLLQANREMKEWLKAKGVAFTDVETEGAHTWQVWRRNLAEFAVLLFR
jgi:enterochelin esterase-like enzyme